jgi:hypothetical protein
MDLLYGQFIRGLLKKKSSIIFVHIRRIFLNNQLILKMHYLLLGLNKVVKAGL